jgi:hypothetical protein
VDVRFYLPYTGILCYIPYCIEATNQLKQSISDVMFIKKDLRKIPTILTGEKKNDSNDDGPETADLPLQHRKS